MYPPAENYSVMHNTNRRVNPGLLMDELSYQDPSNESASSLQAEVRLSDAGYYPITVQNIDLTSPDAQLFVSFENDWQCADRVPISSVRLNPEKVYAGELRPPYLPPKTLCQGDNVEVLLTACDNEQAIGWHAAVVTAAYDQDQVFVRLINIKGEPRYVVKRDKVRAARLTHIISPDMVKAITFRVPRELEEKLHKTCPDYNINKELCELIGDAIVTKNKSRSEYIIRSVYEDTLKRAHLIQDTYARQLSDKINNIVRYEQTVFQTVVGRRHIVECGEIDEMSGSMTMIDAFVVQADLVGLAIGTKGANIDRARHIHGIIRIDTQPLTSGENTQQRAPIEFRVHATSHAAINGARKMLEFVEGCSLVPRDICTRLMADDGAIIQKLVDKSDIARVRIDGNFEKQSNKQDVGSKKLYDGSEHEGPVAAFFFIGLRHNVQNAMFLLQYHVKLMLESTLFTTRSNDVINSGRLFPLHQPTPTTGNQTAGNQHDISHSGQHDNFKSVQHNQRVSHSEHSQSKLNNTHDNVFSAPRCGSRPQYSSVAAGRANSSSNFEDAHNIPGAGFSSRRGGFNQDQLTGGNRQGPGNVRGSRSGGFHARPRLDGAFGVNDGKQPDSQGFGSGNAGFGGANAGFGNLNPGFGTGNVTGGFGGANTGFGQDRHADSSSFGGFCGHRGSGGSTGATRGGGGRSGRGSYTGNDSFNTGRGRGGASSRGPRGGSSNRGGGFGGASRTNREPNAFSSADSKHEDGGFGSGASGFGSGAAPNTGGFGGCNASAGFGGATSGSGFGSGDFDAFGGGARKTETVAKSDSLVNVLGEASKKKGSDYDEHLRKAFNNESEKKHDSLTDDSTTKKEKHFRKSRQDSSKSHKSDKSHSESPKKETVSEQQITTANDGGGHSPKVDHGDFSSSASGKLKKPNKSNTPAPLSKSKRKRKQKKKVYGSKAEDGSPNGADLASHTDDEEHHSHSGVDEHLENYAEDKQLCLVSSEMQLVAAPTDSQKILTQTYNKTEVHEEVSQQDVATVVEAIHSNDSEMSTSAKEAVISESKEALVEGSQGDSLKVPGTKEDDIASLPSEEGGVAYCEEAEEASKMAQLVKQNGVE